jgi:GT2 family glycosyltransferase
MLYPPLVVACKERATDADFHRLTASLQTAEFTGQIQLRLATNFSMKALRDLKPDFMLTHPGNSLNYIGECHNTLKYTRFTDKVGEILEESFIPSGVLVNDQTVTVIVTTYNNPDVSIRCIDSILESLQYNKTSIRILVADNASTDPRLNSYLANLGNKIYLLKWRENLGYIRSVNMAMIHCAGDLITLNSDTVVHGNWVDRLRKVAYYEPRIASVTPFSNNADGYSYPDFGSNPLNLDLVPIYDNIVAKVECPKTNYIPIIHGFCAYYKREALNDVGLFDDHAYEMGYGDEVDWSYRATNRGWHHMMACNVYIGHEGSATFTPAEKNKYMLQCMDLILARWDSQADAVMHWFKSTDPLIAVRKLLDQERRKESSVKKKELLLGAGFNHRKQIFMPNEKSWQDLTTLDINQVCNPDMVWDLEKLPLPFDDSTFDEVHAYQILEHLGTQGDWKFFFDQFTDLWRILKPNGYLIASVPDSQSKQAWGDPSHKRVINDISISFLSQAKYKNELELTTMSDFRERYKADFQTILSDIKNEVYVFILKAIKP